MAEYIFLMHDDAILEEQGSWEVYISFLKRVGAFDGGSEIGKGVCFRRGGNPASLSKHLTGYMRVTADSLDHAKSLVIGNPHYEAGGTVEVRELPRS